ncbi:hypothetical protein AB0G35_13830 [Streptomyces sp. NPDC021749]|uniref:hypothetical protein n=1 Tax=Streptomyces sp. NPDC021749 TaxID=3154905 RepID=UPI0033ED9CA1
MRKSMDRTARGLVCAPAAWALPAALSSAPAPASPGESARIPLAQRFRVARRSGRARAADSSLTCAARPRGAAREHAAAQKDGAGAHGRHRRAYTDVGSGPDSRVRRTDLRTPARPGGRAGVVAHGGDRGGGPGRLPVPVRRHRPYALHDSAVPANDVKDSTVTEFCRESARRPAPGNTLGPDSGAYALRPALRYGGDRLTFRFSAHRPGYPLGTLFVQTDTRR